MPNDKLALSQRQSTVLRHSLPLMLVAELAGAAIIGWFYYDHVAPSVLTSWLLAFVAFALVRFFGVRASKHKLSNPQIGVSILVGAVFFAIAAILFNPLSGPVGVADTPRWLFGTVCISLAIVAIACYAVKFRYLLGYLLVLLVPDAIIAGLYNVQVSRPQVAALLPLIILALLVAGYVLHRLLLNSLLTQLDNQSLIRFLEKSRNDAEELSEQLAREMFERRETRQQLQETKDRLEIMVNKRTKALELTNQELSSTSQRLQLALDASLVYIWEWDILANSGYQTNFQELFGFEQPNPNERPIADVISERIHPQDLPMVEHAFQSHLKGQAPSFHCTYRIRYADNSWHWLEDNAQVIRRNNDGRAAYLIGTRRDVTQSYEADQQRRLAASVFENAPEGIEIFDTDMRFLAVNDSFTRITGFTEADALGRCVLNFGDEKNQALYRRIHDILRTEGVWQGEITQMRKNGETYPMNIQLHAVYDDYSQLTHYVGMVSDVSKRKRDEARLQFLSNHDRLTGLANRNQFNESLQKRLSIARLKREQLALLYIDLDRFKPINDTLGHQIGDEVLRITAKRLINCGLTDSQVARIDSDEFTILTHYYERAEIETLCQRIIGALKEPINLQQHELLVGASIGISLFPKTAKDAHTMTSQADVAMHQAKHMGGGTFQYYHSGMRTSSVEQLALETSLRKAVSRNEFVVYYQPKVDLHDGVIRSAEALVRWQHPTMGLLSPGIFIPLAEETGLITEIGQIVLDEAVRQTQEWHQRGIGTITTSVNLSAHQFRSTDIVSLVENALKESGLSHRQLEMELTETLLMDDLESNIETLNKLRRLGVKLSLDDFGTGYSSLSYLKRFPIDELKIDRAFVMDLENNKEDAAITRAIVTMAHSLRMRVVAEGVETKEQLDILNDMDCDTIQGYYISKPVPAAEMEILLFQQRHRYKQV